MTQEIPKPTIKENPLAKNCLVIPCGDNGYDFLFSEHNVGINFPFIRDNGRGLLTELTIEAPPGINLKSNISFNLNDSFQRTKLATDLAKTDTEFIPWDALLEYVVSETIRRYRIPPGLLDISADPENRAVEYLLEPLLALNQPTTIFSMGGKGKSILADFIAVTVTHGVMPLLPFIPRQEPTQVLYLDWEADLEIHRRYITAIEKGLGLEHRPIHYLNCDLPFSEYRDALRQMTKELGIALLIIDSQMAATAGNPHGMTESQVGGQYYNDLRTIGLTSLTIDHVSKQSMALGDSGMTPYGTVVKYNRSRSQYELKQTQEPEADIMELALIHLKFNLGKKSKPLGIRIEFTNTEAGELDQIDFTALDIASNIELVKALPLKPRVRGLLLDEGALSISEIASSLDEHEPSIKTILYREKKLFIKMGDKWGVIAQ